MTCSLAKSQAHLIGQLTYSERGPRRNGVFALWMFVGVSEGLMGQNPVSVRNHHRRVAALKKRLSSLSLPAQLRRVVPSALNELETATRVSAAQALSLLVAPTIETISKDCGEIITSAAFQAAAPPANQDDAR